MEEVPVCCCENVAENDTRGLVTDSFSSVTVLLPFPKHRFIYIYIYIYAHVYSHLHTCTHTHTQAFCLGAGQHFFLPVGR